MKYYLLIISILLFSCSKKYSSKIKEAESSGILDLSGKNLDSIPFDISTISDLKEIYLSRNNFTSIPSTIYKHEPLQKLVFEENHITEIDQQIGSLINLNSLNMFQNRIKSLPSSISNRSAYTKCI